MVPWKFLYSFRLYDDNNDIFNDLKKINFMSKRNLLKNYTLFKNALTSKT